MSLMYNGTTLSSVLMSCHQYKLADTSGLLGTADDMMSIELAAGVSNALIFTLKLLAC